MPQAPVALLVFDAVRPPPDGAAAPLQVTPFRLAVACALPIALVEHRPASAELVQELLNLVALAEDLPFAALLGRLSGLHAATAGETQRVVAGLGESVDALLERVDSLDQAVRAESTLVAHFVDRKSVLGRFVRQVVVGCKEMLFGRLCRLVDDLRAYTAEPAAGEAQPAPPARLHEMSATHSDAFFASLATRVERIDAAVGPELDALAAAHPQNARVHYLRGALALRSNDLTAAIDHFHRFFDQASSTEQLILPQALLNVARVHVHFGHTDEALQCMDECIHAAQHHQDDECIRDISCWLALIAHQRGDAVAEKQLVQRILSSPQPAMGRIAHARHAVEHAQGPASAALEILQELGPAGELPADLRAALHNTAASAWETFGNPEMTRFHASSVVELKAAVPATHLSVALCTVARLDFDNGQFHDAVMLVDAAKRPLPPQDAAATWLWTASRMLVEWARARGDPQAASLAAERLGVAAAIRGRPHDAVAAKTARAQVLAMQRRQDEACRLLSDVVDGLDERTGPTFEGIGCLLVLAELYQALDAPSNALQVGLEALSLAKKMRAAQLETEAAVAVAEIQLQLGYPDRARSMVAEWLPRIYQHRAMHVRARALLLKVKSSPAGDPVRLARLAEKAHRLALGCQSAALCRASAYLAARFHHALGNIAARDHMAAAFQRFSAPDHPAAGLDPAADRAFAALTEVVGT